MIRLILFTAILATLFSCKKDEPVKCLSVEYGHYVGNFHCTVISEYNYDGYSDREYDQVVRCYIENDSLRILDYAFPLTDPEQTVFVEGIPLSGSHSAQFTFSPDFNYLSIYLDYPSQLSGPSSSLQFYGPKSPQPETVDPHPLLPELEGNYLLDVTKIQQGSGIDTHFIDLLYVTNSNGYMHIDGDSFHIGLFHGQSEMESVNTMVDERYEKSIYWKNDSLFLDYMRIYPVWTSTPDTTHYIYHGVKQ